MSGLDVSREPLHIPAVGPRWTPAAPKNKNSSQASPERSHWSRGAGRGRTPPPVRMCLDASADSNPCQREAGRPRSSAPRARVLETRYTLVSATGEGVRHTEPPLRTRLITPVEGTPPTGVFLFPAAGGHQAVLSDVERVCDFLIVLDRGTPRRCRSRGCLATSHAPGMRGARQRWRGWIRRSTEGWGTRRRRSDVGGLLLEGHEPRSLMFERSVMEPSA